MSFGFMFYDLIFFSIFVIAVVWFLVSHRKNLGREGLIFLYRTQTGIKIIDNLVKKCRWMLKPLSYLIVLAGYVMMAIMLYLLFQLVGIFAKPEYVQAIKIPPLMPLIPYLPELFGISWLPPLYFTYWIVVTAIIALIHEGMHGIYARFYGVKVKSTGFGFLGPILTFFVEPDEKQVKKKKIFSQLAIIGSGVFGNLLAAIFFFIIMLLFFSAAYSPAGALFNTYTFSPIPVSEINNAEIGDMQVSLDGLNLTEIRLGGKIFFVWEGHLNKISEYEEGYIKAYHDQPALAAQMHGAIIKIEDKVITKQEDISAEMSKYEPGDIVFIRTKDKTGLMDYIIELGEDYDTKGRAVIGIGVIDAGASGIRGFFVKIVKLFRNPTTYYEPKIEPELMDFIYYLLWWIVLINIGVALFNILPLGIADGGRFWYLSVLAITKNEGFAKKSFKAVTGVILFIFLLLMVLWAIGMF